MGTLQVKIIGEGVNRKYEVSQIFWAFKKQTVKYQQREASLSVQIFI